MTWPDRSGPIPSAERSSIRETSWEPNQTIDVDTFSGNVELHVPETARGSVSFNSFSGRLNSEMPLTLHSSSRDRSGPTSAAAVMAAPLQNLQRQRQDRPLTADTIGVARTGFTLL